MALKVLTEEEATDRLLWLEVQGTTNVLRMRALSDRGIQPNAQDVERLRQISRVASQVAKHYEDRL